MKPIFNDELKALFLKYDSEIDYGYFNQCSENSTHSEDCQSCVTKSYFEDKDKPKKIHCASWRRMYILKYLHNYSQQIVEAFFKVPQGLLDRCFSEKKINIFSFGGGPGTDVLGVKRYLTSIEEFNQKHLTHYNLEASSDWQDVHQDLSQVYPVGQWTFKFGQTAKAIELHEVENAVDIVILSMVINELRNEELAELASLIKLLLKPDGFILVCDLSNSPKVVQAKVVAIADELDFKIDCEEKRQIHCGVNYPDEIRDRTHAKFKSDAYIAALFPKPSEEF